MGVERRCRVWGWGRDMIRVWDIYKVSVDGDCNWEGSGDCMVDNVGQLNIQCLIF